MRRGLIIGKFMPVHKGHMALVEFALQHCDHLTLAVCSRDFEPIPGPVRLRWVEELFDNCEKISVDHIDAPLPDSPVSSREVSRIWANYLEKRYPATDVIISSEPYGDYLAEYMHAEHLRFDMDRKEYPVSGAGIRERPLHNWEMLPDNVRPYFIKRICIYGAESTGKSILTRELADHFSTSYVPETARDILGDRHCVAEDIPVIAQAQIDGVERALQKAHKFLFCDTDLITTQIYSIYYFNDVPDVVMRLQRQERYDLHLLLNIDTPWLPDPQRDCGHLRDFFHAWFRYELVLRGLPFVEISGGWEERFMSAVDAVEKMRDAPIRAGG